MRYSTIFLALLCLACSNYSANVPSIKPYKMDIQQGNVVTPKMMMQLRPGMTKSQVRFIMGTPLLTDSFHGDRWDYFYQMRKDGKIIEQRRVILEFDGDALSHVRGDVIPAGGDSTTINADLNKNNQPRPVIKPAAKEKGLLDKLKFWGDDEEGKAVPQKDQPKPAEPVQPAKPETAKQKKPEPKPEPVVAPEPKAEPEAAPAPASQPMVETPKESAPKPAPDPEEKKGWLDKLKFWGNDEKTEQKTTPVEKSPPVKAEPPKAEPPKAAPPKVESKPQAEPPPAPRRRSLPDATPKAPPKPAAPLPPEDAPDFFEKMLEKIGF